MSNRKGILASQTRLRRQLFSLPEVLEGRVLMSTYAVSNTNDDGAGSLRQAILDANSNSGADLIVFASNISEIHLSSKLDPIVGKVTIDGTGETTVDSSEDDHTVPVWIDGTYAGSNSNGLTIAASAAGSKILGLRIASFHGMAGIQIDAADSTVSNCVVNQNRNIGILVTGANAQITDNLIGVETDGLTLAGNITDGIRVDGTGKAAPASASILNNVIAANGANGIWFKANFGSSAVSGNKIGEAVDAGSGETLAAGNLGDGVRIGDANSTIVTGHGAVTVSTNVISGNVNGVAIENSSYAVVTGNFIGTDGTGTLAVDSRGVPFGNVTGNGVWIVGSSASNTIGGPTAADRNIISGNTDGVRITTDSGYTSNVIQNNYIGTNASGTAAIPNTVNGISVSGSSNTIVGNLISGNLGFGLEIGGGFLSGDSNIVQGNRIGTRAGGVSPLPNGYNGVLVDGSNNIIGGTGPGQGNTVAYNFGVGVAISTGTGNSIRGNSIHDNVPHPYLNDDGTVASYDFGIGIDLGWDGVTPNGSGPDGPNNFQNFPVITKAVKNLDGTVTITGTLQSDATGPFTIDLFANSAADPSGYGQGEKYVGSVTDAAFNNSTGLWEFTATVDGVSLGMAISATATDSDGNTSEFSMTLDPTDSTPAAQAATVTTLDTSENPSVYGHSITFTATVTAADAGHTPITSGSVGFYIDGSLDPYVVVGLNNTDQASFTIGALTAGYHTITARYQGSSDFAASSSAPLDETVAKADATLTVDPKSRIYGQGNPNLTGKFSGILNGDDVTASYDTTASQFDDVGGLYPITGAVGGSKLGNYNVTIVDSALTITKADATLTVDPKSRIYGQGNPNLTGKFSGILNGDDVTASYNTTAGQFDDVGGLYPITGSVGGSKLGNYNVTIVDSALTITKADATLTVDPKSRIYGQGNPNLTGKFSGILNGDDVTASYNTTAGQFDDVGGVYPITGSVGGSKLSNYDVTIVDSALTISKADATLTVDPKSKTYGQDNPTLTGSFSGILNGDDVTASYNTTATQFDDVGGLYPVTGAVGGSKLGNYNVTIVDSALTITKASSTTTVTGGTFVYNGSAYPSTSSVSGINLSATANSLDYYNIDNGIDMLGHAPINAGHYTVTATYAGDANHEGSVGTATIVIGKATSMTVVSIPAGPFIYNGVAQTPATVSITGAGALSLTPTASYANNIHAGTATASYIYAGDANHFGSSDSQTFTIGKATSTTVVSLPAGPFIYNGLAQTPATVSITGAGGLSLTPTASYANNLHAGTATASYIYAGDANHFGSSDSQIFTIGKANAIIVVTPYDLTYDGQAHTATGTAKGVLGETLSGLDLSGTVHTNAGTYSDTWAFTDVTGNYNNATLTSSDNIAKAALTIKANNAGRVYGTANPVFSVTSIGFVNSETLANLNGALTISTAATTSSQVGGYAITPGGVSGTNYSITFASGTLTIGKATPILNWANPSDITYGTALSGTQLNASASTSGLFAYTPAAGTVLNTGSGQTLGVIFTPADTTDYNTVSATATINVLAAPASSASGHIFNDVSGNGLSADDTPMSGVSVKLFRDANSNGVLDSGDGVSVQSTTTNASGAYSFSNLNSGIYFVQEVLPSGYIRTAPALSDNYAVAVTGLTNATGLDFDNFNKTCCTNSVANVSFLINGTTTVTNLRGATHQGDTVKAKFTVTGSTAVRLSFVTYNAPDPVFNADDASEQTVYQLVTGLFSPGANSMTVTIPSNYYQIDFVCGYAIDQLGPAGSNIFYSAQSRLISADNGGLHSDTDDEAATTCFWANLGQSLIKSFGGCESSTALGNWLATTYPKMYGASCPNSANNLTNDSNTVVAALFKTFYTSKTHSGADAQVMATALNVYASTLSLGGTAAEAPQYGFDATAAGLGAAEFNVGNNGQAFNVANNSTLTVSQMLAVANTKSSNDVLYNNVTSLLVMAYNMFSQINGSGGIV